MQTSPLSTTSESGAGLELQPGLKVHIARNGTPPLIETADARAARCTLVWQAAGRGGARATLSLGAVAALAARPLPPAEPDGPGVLTVTFIAGGAFQSLFAGLGDGDYYLDDALSALVTAAASPAITGAARDLYQRAKCQELICEIIDRADRGELVPQASTSSLSLQEMERLMAARRIIATRFDEKLTLSLIGRTAGLNRAKLTQGFREVFGQTVADCLAEHRLTKAAADLTSSNRPVSAVGYSAGYLNNASFARAFSKRFGLCPTDYRRAGGQIAMAAPTPSPAAVAA